MLRLSDLVAPRKRLNNLSRGLCISASKHFRKMNFRAHIHLTLLSKILLILSCVSDFMTCRERFYDQSEGSISQLWNTVGT